MLYSIIPPIIVILSLVGIILFLMKKAPQVAQLEDENLEEKKERKTIKKRLKKITRGIIKNIGAGISKIIKIAQEKIKNILEKKGINKNEEKKKKELIKQKRIFRKIKETKQSRQKIEKNLEKFFGKKNNEEKKTVRPIISKKIVRPRKIEKMMIERIAKNPKDVKAYENLGDYYLEIENWEDAKECFKQVIRLEPQNVDVKVKMRKLERIIKY